MTAATPAAPLNSHDRLTAAALDLADQVGFSPSWMITASAAAHAAGVSRATVYRRWDDVEALNDDIVRFGATVHPGWQQRVLEADPARPLDAIVRELVAHPHREAGVLFRCLRPGLHPASMAPDAMSTWEREWLTDFERWIERHLDAHGLETRGQRTAADLALSLACVVEGALLLLVVQGPSDDWAVGHAAAAPAAARALVEHSTTAVPAARRGATRGDSPVGERLGTGPPDPLLAGVFYGLLGSATDPGRAARLIDADALAERTGVSSRWIYKVWPTASEANADIVEALTLRHRERATALAADAVARCLDSPADEHRAIVHDHAVRVIELADSPAARSPLDAIATTRDPVVALRCAPIYVEWETSLGLFTLALLHSTNSAINGLASRRDFVNATVGSVVGASRFSRSGVPDTGSPRVRRDRLAVAVAATSASMARRSTATPP